MKVKRTSAVAAVILLGGVVTSNAHAGAGNAAAGKIVYARCASCHSADTPANRLGPSLQGVIGRKAAAVSGYNYSPALKASGLTWTPAQLDAFLTAPRSKVPGNKMGFVGLPNAADRANVIAYLGSVSPAK
jgi:cytochrome c